MCCLLPYNFVNCVLLQSFVVPEEVYAHYALTRSQGAVREAEWNSLFERYADAHPEAAAEFTRRMNGVHLPDGWRSKLPVYVPDGKNVATRQRSEEVLNALAGIIPEIVGGSADLTPSNLTALKVHFPLCLRAIAPVLSFNCVSIDFSSKFHTGHCCIYSSDYSI